MIREWAHWAALMSSYCSLVGSTAHFFYYSIDPQNKIWKNIPWKKGAEEKAIMMKEPIFMCFSRILYALGPPITNSNHSIFQFSKGKKGILKDVIITECIYRIYTVVYMYNSVFEECRQQLML